MHENVCSFPGEYVKEPLHRAGYSCEESKLSPQRFGRPMGRLDKEHSLYKNTPKLLDSKMHHSEAANLPHFLCKRQVGLEWPAFPKARDAVCATEKA